LGGPTTFVERRQENRGCRADLGRGEQSCHDGDEAANMQYHDENLNFGQSTRNDDIDRNIDRNDKPGQQCTLPQLGFIVRIIEDQESLNDGSSKQRLSCNSCNPSQRCEPSHNVAQRTFVLVRSKNVNPVVLTAGDGAHAGELRDANVDGPWKLV
jgi:hypothetical protein